MTGTDARRLGSSRLFSGLEASALTALAAVGQERHVPAGESVLEEGSEGDTVFVILEGRVRVEKRTAHDDRYTVTFLSGESGDFFGELALLDRDVRSATVVAETDCVLLALDRQPFLDFGDAHPEAGLQVTRVLAQLLGERLRRANRDIVTLFSALVHEVEERI